MAAPGENLLLLSLSSAARALLLEVCRPVSLPIRSPLHEAGKLATHAYFMTDGVASLVISTDDGKAAEVGMIGREGVVGASQVFGSAANSTEAFMQLEGAALRLPLDDLRRLAEQSPEIRDMLLRRLQVEMMIMGQIAGCNRLHEAEERLARWLLTAHDRADTDMLDVTHEFLADMLGARRATVTLVAGALQRAGLIEYRRGRVQILDRAALEATACECYGVIVKLNRPAASPEPVDRGGENGASAQLARP